MLKLTDEQVHVKLLELMGYKVVSGLSGILELFKDGQPQRFPPLDHNLIWEAEEKLLAYSKYEADFDKWDLYNLAIIKLSQFAYGESTYHAVRHAPAIICARALLKTLGVEDE